MKMEGPVKVWVCARNHGLRSTQQNRRKGKMYQSIRRVYLVHRNHVVRRQQPPICVVLDEGIGF